MFLGSIVFRWFGANQAYLYITKFVEEEWGYLTHPYTVWRVSILQLTLSRNASWNALVGMIAAVACVARLSWQCLPFTGYLSWWIGCSALGWGQIQCALCITLLFFCTFCSRNRPASIHPLDPRKAACDPTRGHSFAVVAENDPTSSTLAGGRAGWPPSAFKTYSVDDLQGFFGFKLNFPPECHTDTANALVPDWNQDRGDPVIPSTAQHGNLSIDLINLGGKRVMYKEKVWLRFETAFGPSADFHDAFTLEPPPPKSSETPGWKADCDSLIAQQLPKLKECSQSSAGIQFQFSGPNKGGTFLFKLSLTAPGGELSHNQWAARVTGGANTPEMVAMGEGFQLLPSVAPDSPDGPPSLPNARGHFYQYWPFYATAFLLVFLCLAAFLRRGCSRHTVRERRLIVLVCTCAILCLLLSGPIESIRGVASKCTQPTGHFICKKAVREVQNQSTSCFFPSAKVNLRRHLNGRGPQFGKSMQSYSDEACILSSNPPEASRCGTCDKRGAEENLRVSLKCHWYPLVNSYRPWQIGVGRLVSTKDGLFSGSMFTRG